MLSVAFKFHYFAHWKSNRLRTHQNVEAAIIGVQSEIPYSDLELFIYAFLSLLVFLKNAYLPAYTFRRILLPLPTLIYGCTLVPISTPTPREIGSWVKFVPANEKNNGKTHYSINSNLKKITMGFKNVPECWKCSRNVIFATLKRLFTNYLSI